MEILLDSLRSSFCTDGAKTVVFLKFQATSTIKSSAGAPTLGSLCGRSVNLGLTERESS